MEPLAILVLAVIMAMASAMVIMKSAETIQEYATDDEAKGPKVDVVTIVLICVTIGMYTLSNPPPTFDNVTAIHINTKS